MEDRAGLIVGIGWILLIGGWMLIWVYNRYLLLLCWRKRISILESLFLVVGQRPTIFFAVAQSFACFQI